jgi:flavin-dependent dehydrogenase
MKTFLLRAYVLLSSATFAAVIESDLCVYGGTSGGVAAAVQAARMGKSVVIAEPGKHLGGMTSGGLSAVDIGDPRSRGRHCTRVFHEAGGDGGRDAGLGQGLQEMGRWSGHGRSVCHRAAQGGAGFTDMAKEAGVKVHFGARLASVKKDGARITELVMENGDVFRAKVFIDTSYEGDLMAKAGVSYTLDARRKREVWRDAQRHSLHGEIPSRARTTSNLGRMAACPAVRACGIAISRSIRMW